MNRVNKLQHFNQEGLPAIPLGIRNLRQAITWQAGTLDPVTGKFPKYPKGRNGKGVAWSNPEQWFESLEESLTAAEQRGHSGPGVVLPALVEDIHLVALDWDGVDLDDPKRMAEIDHDWMSLGMPYLEVSPSGKGLRAFVLSKQVVADASQACTNGGKNELFSSSKARFMTVTGNVFRTGGLPDATQAVISLSAKWNSSKALSAPEVVSGTPLQYPEPMMLGHLINSQGFQWPTVLIKDGDGREEIMLSFAGHLRAKGRYTQTEIEQLCLQANIAQYADPLDGGIVLDKARRYIKPFEETAIKSFDDWGALVDLPPKYPQVPALDPDLLPSAIAGYVADCAQRMRIPAEMIATPLIVALGSVFGKKVCVQPRAKDSTWFEYPNFWGASILPPAMLKSPSLNAAMKFINELERNAQLEHAKAMSDWESEERVRKLELKITERSASLKLKDGDRQGAKRELDRLQLDRPPVRRRYIITDATPEARLQILCDNANGVVLLRDELDGHIAQLRKDGYENARAQELQFFDGHQDYSDDRIKRGNHIAEGPRMALYGNLQPAKVEKYLRDLHKGGSDDGYLQRLLQLAIQPTINQKYELLDVQPDRVAEGEVRKVFMTAERMPLSRDALTKRIKSRILKFDYEAQQAFDQFLIVLENKLRGDSVTNPVIAAHYGKYRGTVAKLALLMQLVENPDANSISYSAYTRAEGLLLFFREHAQRIYGVVRKYDLASAYELLARIKKGQIPNGFNARDDVQRKEWDGLRTGGEIEAAVDLLVRHGYLRAEELQTNGRNKRIIQIHPELMPQKP